ncbi:MAG: hypothetical protein U0797_29160 [Gemmataceae bacterium]
MNLFRTCLKGHVAPRKPTTPDSALDRRRSSWSRWKTAWRPVVGNTVVPAPVAPGGPYDGVVLLNRLNGAPSNLGAPGP